MIGQVCVRRHAGNAAVVAKSPGVDFALEEAAVAAAVRFGNRPPGVRCPEAIFARPAGDAAVMVVRVADLQAEGDDPPLGFYVLLLDRDEYPGDPFDIARRFPPSWSARGELPDLEWVPEWPPYRTADEIQWLLKSGDGPLLLGATQAVLDGGRVAVVRTAPDPGFVRGVWQLLPTTPRRELWPATFAFADGLGCNLMAVATPAGATFLTEEQARDYPEGRYELRVQLAAEAGDQGELDRLFARKSSRDVMRLGIMLVAAALIIAGVLRLF